MRGAKGLTNLCMLILFLIEHLLSDVGSLNKIHKTPWF